MIRDFHILAGKTLVFFGLNSTFRAKSHLKGKRALIVTGSNSARRSGALQDIVSVLEEKRIEYCLYDKVKPNPTSGIVEEIASHARECTADIIVAIGGGSVIDAAKLASVCYAENGNPEEYVLGLKKPEKHVPLIAVNLTHGTGTEVDRFSVINLPERREKRGISTIYPVLSIDNPKYTLTMPEKQITATSLDALYHIIESYISDYSSPYVRDLDERAITYILEHLPKAIIEKREVEHRYWLQYASMLAGIAIDHGFTYIIHALEHGLSGVNPSLEHGIGLAIIGPRIIEYIYKVIPFDAWGILRYIDPTLRPTPSHARKASESLEKFQKKAGHTYMLSDYGFTLKDLVEAVEKSWPLVARRLGNKKFLKKEKVLAIIKETI